jgi:cytochrome c-type biogenesis protein CcmE
MEPGAFGPVDSDMRPTPVGPDADGQSDDRSTAPLQVELPLERPRSRLPFVLLGLLALAALGWFAVDAFQGSVVYYLTPTEAAAAPEGVFRLAGHVAEGSIGRDADGAFRFAVTDGRTTIPVRFEGRPPDALEGGAEAVAEGRFGPDGTFEADRVLARCASRFEADWEGS